MSAESPLLAARWGTAPGVGRSPARSARLRPGQPSASRRDTPASVGAHVPRYVPLSDRVQ